MFCKSALITINVFLYSGQIWVPWECYMFVKYSTTGYIPTAQYHLSQHNAQIYLAMTQYRRGTVQTRWCWRKDQKEGGWVDARKREFAERYRTGAMWPESVSSSSVHQLQYTHSDDAWKSIYATSRERRQHRDRGREIQRVDWRIDVSILLVSGQNQTTEKVKFHSKSQQFTFRFSNLSHPQTLII